MILYFVKHELLIDCTFVIATSEVGPDPSREF